MTHDSFIIVYASIRPLEEHELDLCTSRAAVELIATSDLPVIVLDGEELESKDMESIRLLNDTKGSSASISQERTALRISF